MPRSSFVPAGVLPRVALAVGLTVIALAALSITAVRVTRSATAGADRVEAEFAEHVLTGKALLAASDSVALAEERLNLPSGRDTTALDDRIAGSDADLTTAISEAR